MYIPKYYQVEDFNEIKAFIEEHSFATIISVDGTKPLATHVPVSLQEINNELYISGHFAKGNQQWKTLDNNEHVLAVFQGPHGYISSTWYEDENVPTWNYQSVHVYGTSQLLSENELRSDLTYLLEKYEGHRENGATWDNLSDQTRKQMKGIVGFMIKVNDILAAYKLSQNRTETDYQNIINELNQITLKSDQQLAEVMENKS